MMSLVLGLVAIWAVAKVWGRPIRFGNLLFVLWAAAAIVAVYSSISQAQVILGNRVEEWQTLAFVAFVIWLYLSVLRWIKSRRADVPDDQTTQPPAKPSRAEMALERGARHIYLREIGGLGQSRIQKSRIFVIGAGGLGSPVLQTLGAAGVECLGIIDPDHVERSNLQRQIIHQDANIGMPKVASARAAISAQNPDVEVRTYHTAFHAQNAAELIEPYDLVIDGSDSFDTRYGANQACHDAQKPLIIGALSQWEGQVSVFDTAHNTPCYACLFPQKPAPGLVPSCSEAGVFSALPQIVGAIMAAQALKFISGAGSTLKDNLLIYDALEDEMRKFKVSAQRRCPVCGSKG